MSAPTLGVVGGGAWGVALALAAKRAGSEVVVFSRRDLGEQAMGVRTTKDYADVARARLLLLAVPSEHVRDVARGLGDHLDGGHHVIHGIRGLALEDLSSTRVRSATLETMSDIVREETPVRRVGALGGPVQAYELVKARPSTMVVGSRFPEVIAAATAAFSGPALRVYSTPDLAGLEWASALVGCLSIGVGFATEAGAGPGLLAALITRAVEEAARIAAASGAEERTLFGLAGYGDLLASIALDDRPEVVLGRMLARGKSMAEAVAEAKLRVEGIALVPRVAAFAKERKVQAGVFDALSRAFQGEKASSILESLFAA